MPFRRAPNCATGPFLAGCRAPIVTRRPGAGSPAQRPTRVHRVRLAKCDLACHGARPDLQGCSLYMRWWADLRHAGRLAPMGKRQPIGQLSRRLIWSGPVKGHHGRRDPWRPHELGAPAVADGHDLYEVRAPADGFFEAMNGHSSILNAEGERGRSYASAAADQAKRHAKAASTPSWTQMALKKNFSGGGFSTVFARVINIFSTAPAMRGIVRADARLQ